MDQKLGFQNEGLEILFQNLIDIIPLYIVSTLIMYLRTIQFFTRQPLPLPLPLTSLSVYSMTAIAI